MKIPKYWARSIQVVQEPGGKALRLACWMWSDTSLDHARQMAEARTREVAQKVRAGARLSRYAYDERPLREEIIEGVRNRAGNEIAVVTRNRYGARVLNATNAMFIDIDFPEKGASPTLAGGLQRLLGGRPPASQADQHVERISAWARQRPDLSLRVYRTFGGLRCLVTNQVFDPSQPEALGILRQLGSDPLYVRLCQAQGCFRARLTPKPWRCGMYPPPSRYPWEDYAAERRYRDWEQRYEQSGSAYSVCKLVNQLGPDETHPDIEPVVALHDRLTGIMQERRLA